MHFNNEKLLVIAPHPDDEILGCFSLINNIKKNGGKVYVQILTLGGYTRTDTIKVKKQTWRKEFEKAVKVMDIDGYDIMFYSDKIKWLDRIPVSQLIGYIESKSKISLFKIKPTIVAIPTIFSTHQDHTQAYKASIAALRNNPHQNYSTPKLILSYESPEYNFWSPYIEFGNFSPNFYIKISREALNKKTLALKIYKTQIQKGKRGDKHIKELCIMRGNEIGSEYAEAFHIHRFSL